MMVSTQPRKRTVAASALWYTAASLATKGLSYITIPIFTRLMTPGEFGDFNVFAAFQVLVVAVIGMEAFQTINRARFDFSERDQRSYQFTAQSVSVGAGGILLSLVLMFPDLFEAATRLDAQYLVIMCLYGMFFPSFAMFQAFQRVRYRYKLASGVAFAVAIVATIMAVTLVIGLSDALMGRIVGQYTPFIILGLVLYVVAGVRSGRPELRFLRYLVGLSLPLVLATLGTQGIILGGRLVVQHLSEPNEVAYIALGTSVVNIALVLVIALNNAWAPWLMDCLEKRRLETIRQSFLPLVTFVSLLCLTVSFLAPEVVWLLGGVQYAPTVALIPSLMSTALGTLIIMQDIYVQTYHKRVLVGSCVTLGAAMLNAVLCVIGVELWGFASVGYAAVVSYGVLMLVQQFLTRRMAGRVLSVWLTWLPFLGVVAFIPLQLYLYQQQFTLVRYAVFCTCLVGAGAAGLHFIIARRRRARK